MVYLHRLYICTFSEHKKYILCRMCGSHACVVAKDRFVLFFIKELGVPTCIIFTCVYVCQRYFNWLINAIYCLIIQFIQSISISCIHPMHIKIITPLHCDLDIKKGATILLFFFDNLTVSCSSECYVISFYQPP